MHLILLELFHEVSDVGCSAIHIFKERSVFLANYRCRGDRTCSKLFSVFPMMYRSDSRF